MVCNCGTRDSPNMPRVGVGAKIVAIDALKLWMSFSLLSLRPRDKVDSMTSLDGVVLGCD